MEIKINFNQLFSSNNELNTTQETPSTPADRSLQSLNSSFEYHLSLDPQLFQPPLEPQSPPSLEPTFGEQPSLESTPKSPKSDQVSSYSNEPLPGQRLYYESQAAHQRKIKQRERIQIERQNAIRRMPFAPAINKNSKRMAERGRVAEVKPAKKEETKTTKQIRQQAEIKQCTFKPKLVSKASKTQKTKEQLFYMLHSASKIRQLKLKGLKEEHQITVPSPKMTEKQFSEFLKRNSEYSNVAKKKLELMKQTAQMYDFKTGDRLFSPKLTESRPIYHAPSSHNLSSPPSTHKLNSPSSASATQPKSGIFRKKQQTYETPCKDSPSSSRGQRQPESDLFEPLNGQQVIDEQEISQQYRRYSEEYDRMLSMPEGSISNHEVILEQPEVRESSEASQQWQESGSVHAEDINMWGSAEVSDVKQFLAGSEEDEPQPRNSYVMDILTNLITERNKEDRTQDKN